MRGQTVILNDSGRCIHGLPERDFEAPEDSCRKWSRPSSGIGKPPRVGRSLLDHPKAVADRPMTMRTRTLARDHLKYGCLIFFGESKERRWAGNFNPFFGFKRLQEEDPREKLFPFSIEEQKRLRDNLPPHWRPYFDFAFRTGLRTGE